MNNAVHSGLSQFFNINTCDSLNPGADLFASVCSKAQKLLKAKRRFHAFSERRLRSFQGLVDSHTNARDFDFFHGITPWIRTEADKPTFAYADACFVTYMDLYHDPDRFSQADLQRIIDLERSWLKRAKRVFFSSQFALEDARRGCRLDGENFVNVGLGASSEFGEDIKQGVGPNLVFIANDFHRKGGVICTEMFHCFRKLIPNATLTIIGDKPTVPISQGINYLGFLDKSRSCEREQFDHVLANAAFLVLPTTSDLTPLVIAEAASHGCPTIASRVFGIPEMILNGETGILFDLPIDPEQMATKVATIFRKQEDYRKMRARTFEFGRSKFSWESTISQMVDQINESCLSKAAPLSS